jgi:hypothetical protein
MAKLPGGGGSGRDDRVRDADRSLGHVMVVRISSAALEHDPEKWEPVFREDHAPTTSEHDPEKWEPVFREDHARTTS